ncbi:P1 family peptidase [Streptomyces sp. H27-S2]|uniref:P1 family peptidase n=1 Tax=Streptomyces antarcticus TaxID=2996458 RepID=UPI00226E2B89|nr:P1 family peptidase [Streptomyces sp. H27-S2]MCY0950458.1 P1 family peptidase [Streptomyces sp. H27-S2]
MERVDAITDVVGLRVGHAQLVGSGALTGTTVVLAPVGGAVAAVDVRGGGPGTHETDALDPRNLVQRVEAVVLTGGSAYGLAAVHGVMAWLEEQGRGVSVGPRPGQVVPVVPAAALLDLGRGGDFAARPDASLGRAAVEAAARTALRAPVLQGCVGAGTGAVAGGLRGGTGSAGIRLESGITVGALAVVNAAGSVVDPHTGALYGEFYCGRVEYPEPSVHQAAQRRLARARAETQSRRHGAEGEHGPLNTTLAVVATDARLTRAQAQKVAGAAHDGLARAIRPVHLMNDGDTVFALSTEEREVPDTATLNAVLAGAADAVMRSIVKAVRAAEGFDGPGGVFPAYGDLY